MELINVVERVVPIVKEGAVNNPPLQNSLGYSEEKVEMFDGVMRVFYPGIDPNRYLVFTRGVVLDTYTNNWVALYETNTGYIGMMLKDENDIPHSYHLHRIVAYAFRPHPDDISGLYVNHIDGNKLNSYANNLEWVTVTANNQHAMKLYGRSIKRGMMPEMTENLVRHICEQFEAGKTNVEIINEMKWPLDNRSHTQLRDLRGGYTWKDITSQYHFDKSSKKHAYDNNQKNEIKQCIIDGKSDVEIFAIMQGREYVPSLDRLDSKYRTINSLRVALRKKGYTV